MEGGATILGLSAGTLPQWGAFGTLLTMAVGLLAAWIKGLPDRKRADNEGRKIDIDANAATRAIDRDDVQRLTVQVGEIAEKLALTFESCRVLKVQVGQLNFALRLAIHEIEVGLPQSQVPSQIRDLLAAVFPTEDPSGMAQGDMDLLRKI